MFNVVEIDNDDKPYHGLPVAFDGDQIAFICSAGNETRAITARENKPFTMPKEFSTRTEFYASIGGKKNADNYTIEDLQRPFHFDKCKKSIDETIESVLELVQTDKFEGYLAEGSPREKWATLQKYKGNRVNMIRPIQLKQARQYLVDHWGFQEIDGSQFETDDVVCIKGTEGYCMYSNDKDSRQQQGAWLLMNSFKEPKKMAEGLGWFDVDKSGKTPKPVGEGEKHLAFQVCCGDTSDAYDPKYLVNVRFGAMGAKKVLDECHTRRDMWVAVTDLYKQWYETPVEYKHAYTGEPMLATWHSVFSEIYQMARMADSFENPWKTGYQLMDELEIDYENT